MSAPKPIGITKVRKVVKEIAAENPDFVYTDTRGFKRSHGNCQYFAGGARPKFDQPSCIVGHVISRLGIDPTPLKQSFSDTDSDPHPFNKAGIARVNRELGWFDDKATEYLKNVQNAQDEGQTWAVAATGKFYG